MENDNKVYFLLEERDTNNKDDTDISKMLDELNEQNDLLTLNDTNISQENMSQKNMMNSLSLDDYEYMDYFAIKNSYDNPYMYYDKNYTIKELYKICNYYEIAKVIKAAKAKKHDIIETIIVFEELPENFEIVQKRNILWSYITQLLDDPKTKKYILW